MVVVSRALQTAGVMAFLTNVTIALSGKRAFGLRLILIALPFAACVSAVSVSVGEKRVILQAGDGVSVVYLRQPDTPQSETGQQISGCVAQAIHTALPDLRLVDTRDFLRAAFPRAPAPLEALDPRSTSELLGHAALRERAAVAGVRYLIIVGFFKTPFQRSAFWAHVYDLAAGILATSARVDHTGFHDVVESVLAGVRTEPSACAELGTAVVTLLGESNIEDVRQRLHELE